MVVLRNPQELTAEDMRHGIVSDLERVLPEVDSDELDREVMIELDRFDDARVRQYLPVLVARQVRAHHR